MGGSLGTDYFGLRDGLTDAELAYLKRTRNFVDTEVLPVINVIVGRDITGVGACS